MSHALGRGQTTRSGSHLQRTAVGGVLTGVGEAITARDEEICRRLVEDLDGGFVDLVGAYGPVVLSVAARATGAPEDAEDLAAEAFLRAYRALRGYGADRIRKLQVRPWLVTIVLNAARNLRRDAARRPRTETCLGDQEPVAPTRDLSEHAEATEAVRELAARLSALPAKQRIAVVLRHVVELPASEIAAVLGCPEATVRSHVARGLAALRAAYRADGSAAVPVAGQLRKGRSE